MRNIVDNIKEKTIMLRERINSNVILKNCIINFAFMVLFLLLGPVFEENDDVGIERIASGFFDEPSSFLVFSNIILGKILSTLYKIIPSIKWYVVLMYCIIYFSFCIVSIICDRVVTNNTLSCVIKYPFIIVLGFEIYCSPQFTKTAGIASLAGGCLLLHCVVMILTNSAIATKDISINIFVAIIFLLCGSAVRIESFLLIMLFVLIVLFRELYKFKNNSKFYMRTILRIIAPFGVVAILVGSIFFIDRLVYTQSGDWNNYTKWNNLRSWVVDFNTPDYHEYEDKYKGIGLSENDYYMLKNWAFGDVDFYTSDRLQLVLDIDTSKNNSDNDIINTLMMSLKNMLFGLSGQLFLYMIFIWLVLDKKNFIDSLCILGLITFLIGFAAYYGLVDRILNRVNVVVFLGAFLVVMFCMDDAPLQIENNKELSLIIVGLVMAMLSNKFCNNIETYKMINSKEIKYQERTKLIASDSDIMYVNDVSQNIFDEAWCGVFDRIPQNMRFKNVIPMGGWDINSPSWKKRMYSMGVTNIFRDAVDNNKVMFITNESRKPYIEKYINEHYNPIAKLNKVMEFQDGIGYYNVITMPDYNAFDLDAINYNCDYDGIVHYVRAIDEGDKYYIDGTVYRKGMSSYEQDVFLACDNGVSMNVTKKESQERNDDYNGQYGNFSIEVNKGIVENSLENVYIILVVEDKFYKIQIDEVL